MGVRIKEDKGMACEHKRLKSVNCVIMCADCGAKVDLPAPVEAATEGKAEATEAQESKKRRTRKKEA